MENEEQRTLQRLDRLIIAFQDDMTRQLEDTQLRTDQVTAEQRQHIETVHDPLLRYIASVTGEFLLVKALLAVLLRHLVIDELLSQEDVNRMFDLLRNVTVPEAWSTGYTEALDFIVEIQNTDEG